VKHWLCKTCGVQFAASEQPPQICPICSDERQYVGYEGQQWTTLDQMHSEGFRNQFKEHEEGLTGIGTTPSFAIGQRALLVQSEQGNILWDCISLIDDETVTRINQLGGLSTIAISHPHFYSSMVEWATRFDVPIYLHEADRRWVMRPDKHLRFWSGDIHPLTPDITLYRLGGHFPGSSVLHWQKGAGGQGVLLTGDTIQVVADRRWLTFLYSYPNEIPLPASEVARISQAVAPLRFEQLYGGWFEKVVARDAHNAVQRSAERYIRALERVQQ
jgi:glyoxylase-like metal-dependent hydrolase (beta-lactamase superfamily II)